MQLAALAFAQAAPRVAVDCSVSSSASEIAQGEEDVTSVRCSERDGFFVPSGLYRDLSKLETEAPHLREEIKTLEAETVELRLANVGLTKAGSAAVDRAKLAENRVDELEEEASSISRSPVLWLLAGVAVAIGSAYAYSLIDKSNP